MKLYNTLLKVSLFFLFLTLVHTPLQAQTDSRLRMATLFKNSGSYEEALELYLQIYRSGKTSRLVINDILFCYEKLKRYDELIDFLQQLIRKFPQEPEYRVKLGKAYYLNEQREKAFTLWDQLVQRYARNAYFYRILGNTLIELRLYDKAIEVYQKGIQTTGSQYSLYRDIALLYRAQLEYGQAAISYMEYLKRFPKQFFFVQSQIIAMASDSSAVRKMINALETYHKQNKGRSDVQQILADLYLRNGDFERSLALYLDLHKKAPQTNYLLQFVQKAARNQAYNYALQALNMLIREMPQPQFKQKYTLQAAKYYYAWARLLASQKREKESQKKLHKALQLIDGLLNSKSTYRWAALELRGDIYFHYFEDIDQAIQDYTRFLKGSSSVSKKDQVRLKLAKCFLAKGDLQQTRTLLTRIRSNTFRSVSQFLLADLLFYQGKLTAARKAFEQLSHTLAAGDSLKNNVLQRLLLLNYAQQDSATLAEYGRAEFLIAQKKLSQAAGIFKKLAFSNSPLAARCAERAVDLLVKLHKFDEAKQIIAHVLQNDPEYVNNDRLLFVLASIQEKQNQLQEAFKTYRLVLTRYPNSFFVEQSRERARWLKEKLEKEQVP